MPHDFDGARACWICRDVEANTTALRLRWNMHCGKCRQVHSDNVSRYCHCSGPYQLVLSKPKLRRRLRTIGNVAIVHDLSRLRVSTLNVLGGHLR
ncbi:hypothetical protein M405DRAFT_929735, partial [Rhizopogon salebrosus TDB-379]